MQLATLMMEVDEKVRWQPCVALMLMGKSWRFRLRSKATYCTIYKKLSPTPKLNPFRPSSPCHKIRGSEKLTSNLAAG